MADASELRTLVKQLQSCTTDEELKGCLTVLKKEARISEALLRDSKAGLAVGKLRQHGTREVAELAKEIVRKWKTEVDREKAGRGAAGGAAAGTGKAAGKESAAASRKASATPTPATPTTPSSSRPGVRSAKGDGVKTELTGDKTRDKCMELIYDALASDSGAPSEQILTRARAIEAAVLAAHSDTGTAYRAKIRSLFVNLKDKNNPGLRESVVFGDLPAERFARMTSAEMASEERKAADNKIRADNLFGSLAAHEQQAETDAFQCGRCKQRKCRYRQAQTRSADEPMTTFVTCTNCGNRWKFS